MDAILSIPPKGLKQNLFPGVDPRMSRLAEQKRWNDASAPEAA